MKTQRKETGEDEVVPALPLQVIERNRLTTDQIRKLPRFASYSPGQPTSVSESTSHLEVSALSPVRYCMSRTSIARPLQMTSLPYLGAGERGCGLK